MGLGDKISNKLDELGGKAKATAGDATDDRSLEAEGHREEAGANLKQGGEEVKDALRAASEAVKGDDKKY